MRGMLIRIVSRPSSRLFSRLHSAIHHSTGSILAAAIVFFVSTSKLVAQQVPGQIGQQTVELFDAIRSGNTDNLQKALSKGSNANDSMRGYSALMAAALSGSVEQ